MSWFTRGYWRETWAMIAIAVWWTILCYYVVVGLYWLVLLIPTPTEVFGA